MRTEIYYLTKTYRLLLISGIYFSFLFSGCSLESTEVESQETSSIVDSSVSIDSTINEDVPIDLENESYSYQTTFDQNIGWGYQILKGDKVYINQPHIPAIPGNNGFSSEEKAKKTAEFAIYKIDNGIMPPTLSKIELDSLGVLDIKE